jgi:hypothetical protein
LLSLLGGTAGLLLSVWLTDALTAILPEGTPRVEQIGLDYGVLAFAMAISALTGILFGLAPALQASKQDVSGSLKEGGRAGEGHRRTGARSLLLVGEVALSLVLLIGAGLLIKSFMRLQEVRPGFNPNNVLISSIALPGAKYNATGQRPEFFRQLAERLEQLPGVQAVGGGINLPLGASDYAIGRAFIPKGGRTPRTNPSARATTRSPATSSARFRFPCSPGASSKCATTERRRKLSSSTKRSRNASTALRRERSANA